MNEAQVSPKLEISVRLLALAVPFAFGLSVLHDWGYYKALGINFNEVPFTWADQLRFSLTWLPGSLSVLAISAAWGVIMVKAQKDVNAKEVWENDAEYQKRISIHSKVEKIGFAISFSCFAIGVVIWVLWGDTKWANMSILLSFWLYAVYWMGFSKSSFVSTWFKPNQWLLIMLIPALWGYPFFSGFYSSDIQKLDLVSIEIKSDVKRVEGYRLIRVYERGVLVTDGTTMLFITNDQITRISRKQMQYKFIGVVGKWWP